ncbi:hypothetical protein [Spiroplasma endosymbiont of Poecilobothrus nobilitatus]|uniref:hypothetical protein n=1 Tax=Spiroplasma endosymbiont of Poecilobothrus nobilitatus TaxID=1209220 RepID=UPI00313AD6CE
MAKQWSKEEKIKAIKYSNKYGINKKTKNLILTILLLFDDEVNLKNMGNMV